MLTMTLLGQLLIAYNGERLSRFRSQKEIALLVYLAQTGKTHSRESLADLLWDARTTSQSLTNLRTVLARLRRRIGDTLLITRKTITYNPEARQHVDSVRFQTQIQAFHDIQSIADAIRLQETLSLYTGDFLADLYLQGAPRFNDWVVVEQERLRLLLFGAYQQLLTYAVGSADFDLGIRTARDWLVVDRWNEATHRQLMLLLAEKGRIAAALKQYELCRQILNAELNVAPSRETTRYYEQIRAGEIQVRQPVAPVGHRPIQHNLPRYLTPFLGRKAEIKQLLGLLSNGRSPLVTLVGPGGIGKSRLAIATAEKMLSSMEHASQIRDGIFFISLVGIETVDQLMLAICDTLPLTLARDGQLTRTYRQQLHDYLQKKRIMLILDNFEQLLDQVDFIDKLLKAVPNLRLLVTSQEPLNIYSEQSVALSGLNYPKMDGEHPRTADFPALSLFENAARRVRPSFAVNTQNYQDVARICRLVLGMPLAIELAAAWIDTLTASEIAHEVQQDLVFLTSDLHGVDMRHRSMRKLFRASWQRLSVDERKLFAQIGVFQQGFSRQAVQKIMNASLHTLAKLVRKALLSFDNETRRYQIHPLLHLFCNEKLEQSPLEAATIHDRHVGYYLDWFVEIGPRLTGSDQKEALALIRHDLENVRAAWLRAQKQGWVQQLARAALYLSYYYQMQSFIEEGARVMQVAAEKLPAVDSVYAPTVRETAVAKAQLNAQQAWFVFFLGRPYQAKALLQQSLTVLQENDADPALLAPLNYAGYVSYCLDEYSTAQKYVQQTLELSVQYGETYHRGFAYRTLGGLYEALGQYETALAAYKDALELARGDGNLRSEAYSLGGIGICMSRLGQFDTAQTQHEAELVLFRELGDLRGEGWGLFGLGIVALRKGEPQTAEIHLRQALSIAQEIGDRQLSGVTAHRIAHCLWLRGEYEAATSTLQRVLHGFRALGDRLNAGWVLGDLARLCLYDADTPRGLAYCEEILAIGTDIEAPELIGRSLTNKGHILAFEGHNEAAAEAYAEALPIWQQANRPRQLLQTKAGLAVTTIALGNRKHALQLVNEVLDSLEVQNLGGMLELFRLYWDCYSVLLATGDVRSEQFLHAICQQLQTRAENIEDNIARQAFLEKPPFQKELAKICKTINN